MKNEISFFLPMKRIPSATQQTHKVSTRSGKPQFYEPQELKTARLLFRDLLARRKPEAPLEGPVYLRVVFYYPATKQHPSGAWKTTRPDTDNLIKMLKDEMTRLGFWKDDAQICSEWISKVYYEHPGIEIHTWVLEEGPSYV